jgi:hypothetical protein
MTPSDGQQVAASMEAGATAAAADVDDQDSSSRSSSSGGRRRLRASGFSALPRRQRQLLSRSEYEKEADYCQYYIKQTTFSQPVYDCEMGSMRRVGVFVSAWVGNTASYLRQLRLQANVDPGSDPSMYVGTLYISQTQPWKQQDPWLPKIGAGKKRSSSRRRKLLGLLGQ